MEHINTAFPEKTRPMMYKMMKWWGGKPHNIWAEYIRRYSEEGDTILDPFCGRGVGVIEAVRNNRKAIGIDLNPIAIFQTEMIARPLDLDRFKKEWSKVKEDLVRLEATRGFFSTVCTKCKNSARMVTVNRERDKPYTIFYQCGCAKGYLEKRLDDADKLAIANSNTQNIAEPYPCRAFPTTDAFDMARKNYGNTYDCLFTKRNLWALSVIFARINKVSDKNVRDFFRFAFISMVHLASRIPSVRENANRVGSGSWGRPAYIRLGKRMEMNPFVLYERAIESRQGIIAGKTSSEKRLCGKIKMADSQENLDYDHNLLLLQTNTLEMNSVEEESVDYVITDPPYGGLIPYFDLSFIWSEWMLLVDNKFAMPFDDEITIDKHRNMDFDEYHRRLRIAFGHVYKVLKSGKYMTVTFHNDKPQIFNSILSACQDNGFILEKVLFQANKRAGETGAASPWGTSVSDFYIRFKKPAKDEPRIQLTDFMETHFANIVERVALEVIAKRGEPTEISAMIPHIYRDMGDAGMRVRFSSDDEISTILNRNSKFVRMDGNVWWFSDAVMRISNLETPLSDRVETAVLDVLRREYKVSYDQVVKNVFETFPNSLTPDTKSIKNCLSDYGIRTNDGKWRLRPGMKEEEVRSKHTDMETALAKLGSKFRYSVWSPDGAKSPELKSLCNEFDIDVPNRDRIRLIDILWMRDRSIKYAFEVENSTSITSALERGSNIGTKDTIKVIVLPEERKKFLERKMKEPLFAEYFKRDRWCVIFYERLESFTNKGGEEDTFKRLLKPPS